MPETGRFMTEDIYKGDGLNRYVYVRNNPLVYIDPTGLCGEGANVTNYSGTLENFSLGIITSLLSNVNLSLAELTRVLYGLFSPDIAQRVYERIKRGGKHVISDLEELVTDEAAYYFGKTTTDVILLGIGATGTVLGASEIMAGLGQIGEGVAASLPTGGTSLVLVATGTVTAAMGTARIKTSWALAASAGKSFNEDSKKLINAIKNSSSKGTSKTVRETLLDSVSNQKLKNAIDQIYRPCAKIGDGGLADAIRHELKTGELVGGKSHITKGIERARNLENIIRTQNLSKSDLEIATKLLNDLKNALGGK